MRVLVLTLLVLTACFPRPAPEVPRTADDERVTMASEHGWRMAGLPEPGACLARLHITWARDVDELAATCGAGAMQCLVGSRVVLGPGQSPRDAIHEAMHALYRCTLREVDLYDYGHTDGRVWRDYPASSPGGADSAQGRAEEAYDER